MNKELELEAEKYYKENVEGEPLTYETPIHCFIAGATSDVAKKYWYKQFEKEKMEVVLPKPTIEEQESLGLIKKPKPPRVKKNYKLKIFYMIGDANGKTSEEAVISINNPFLKPLTEALDKLGEIEGHWGTMLDEKHYDGNRKIGNINDFEYELLSLVTGYAYEEDAANDFFKKYGYDESEQNHNYLQEFEGLLISDTEYSFLVYEGYKLK